LLGDERFEANQKTNEEINKQTENKLKYNIMKAKIVKPAIGWLATSGDPLLFNNISVILLAMAANVAIYKTPTPPLADVQTALDNFSAGVAAAADGGPSATSKKNNLRLILIGLMRQLANYVASACNGDMTNLLLSGFPTQKPVRQPIGVLPAPSNPTLALGSLSGQLDASVNPVFGASIYNWKLTSNVAGAPVLTGQSTASAYTFSGLTPGVSYSLAVNVVGAAGPGNWSQTSAQMVV